MDGRRPRVGAGVPVRRARRRRRLPPALGARPRRRAPGAASTSSRWCASGASAIPDMHIYHYAAYEKTALLRLAGRYGVGEDEVDDLLRNGVLVDLYPLVRKSIRVGAETYSLKSLEPLYMGAELRTGDVTTATDSITQYARYCELRDDGTRRRSRRRAQGDRGLQPLRLPLDAQAAGLADLPGDRVRGATARPPARRRTARPMRPPTTIGTRHWWSSPATASQRPQPRADRGRDDLGRPRLPPPRGQAVLVGAFRPAEQSRRRMGRQHATSSSPSRPKSTRTGTPPPRRHASTQRWVRLTGALATAAARTARCTRSTSRRRPQVSPTNTDRRALGNGRASPACDDPARRPRCSSCEREPKDGGPFDQLPFALTPARPFRTGQLRDSIEATAAGTVAAGLPNGCRASAVVDILLRAPPRTRSRRRRSPAGDDAARRSPPRCSTSTRPTSRCTGRRAPARLHRGRGHRDAGQRTPLAHRRRRAVTCRGREPVQRS